MASPIQSSKRLVKFFDSVRNAIVFITDEKPDLSQFSQYDNYTQEKWDGFMKEKNGISVAPNDPGRFPILPSLRI